MNKLTLAKRLAKRNRGELCSLPPDIHIRAELDRLARQVRKMNQGSGAVGYYAARRVPVPVRSRLIRAVLEHVAHEVFVLAHGARFY